MTTHNDIEMVIKGFEREFSEYPHPENATTADEPFVKEHTRIIKHWLRTTLTNLTDKVREEERTRIKKKVKEVGEHYVKFGEHKAIEALDMVFDILSNRKNDV